VYVFKQNSAVTLLVKLSVQTNKTLFTSLPLFNYRSSFNSNKECDFLLEIKKTPQLGKEFRFCGEAFGIVIVILC